MATIIFKEDLPQSAPLSVRAISPQEPVEILLKQTQSTLVSILGSQHIPAFSNLHFHESGSLASVMIDPQLTAEKNQELRLLDVDGQEYCSHTQELQLPSLLRDPFRFDEQGRWLNGQQFPYLRFKLCQAGDGNSSELL